MTRDLSFWRRLYKAFDPFRPLPARDPAWVDCQAVRGDGDILASLGKEILRSSEVTCQLYAGHRGAGKSTELLRLQDYLQTQGYQAILFALDDNDIEAEDADYSEILLACARQLLKQLKQVDAADREPWQNWLRHFGQSLTDLLQTEIALDDLSLESPDTALGKISATIKTNTSQRQQIRRQIEREADSLIRILNQFIQTAMGDASTTDLVLIVDNLDRISETFDPESQRSNYEQIFINRSDNMRGLDCHIIYTIPISLVYSGKATALEERYKPVQVLPMIMVRDPDGVPYAAGIDALKQMIAQRVKFADVELELTQVFESDEALEQLCLMSGGHVRNLMALMKAALQHTDELPISNRSVRRAISELRQTYRKIVEEDEWPLLAGVHQSKSIVNNDKHRQLLFNRCILEYRLLHIGDDQDGTIDIWHDVHPLIVGLDAFQQALNPSEEEQ